MRPRWLWHCACRRWALCRILSARCSSILQFYCVCGRRLQSNCCVAEIHGLRPLARIPYSAQVFRVGIITRARDYLPFLLAAFGAIAAVVDCRRRCHSRASKTCPRNSEPSLLLWAALAKRQCRGLTAHINEVRSARFTFQKHKYGMNEPYNASLAG